MRKIAEWENFSHFSHSEGNIIEISRMGRVDEGIRGFRSCIIAKFFLKKIFNKVY